MSEDVLKDVSSRQADEIMQIWRSFRESPFRDEIRQRILTAIATAVVNELVFTTKQEMGR